MQPAPRPVETSNAARAEDMRGSTARRGSIDWLNDVSLDQMAAEIQRIQAERLEATRVKEAEEQKVCKAAEAQRKQEAREAQEAAHQASRPGRRYMDRPVQGLPGRATWAARPASTQVIRKRACIQARLAKGAPRTRKPGMFKAKAEPWHSNRLVKDEVNYWGGLLWWVCV